MLGNPNTPSDRDHFTLCLGWLLGPFVKLHTLSISAWHEDWVHSAKWIAVLRNLQRHCRALEALHFLGGCPEPAVKVLPTFSNLLELSLPIHETSGCSEVSLLERLADCSTSLRRLHQVRFQMLYGVEDVRHLCSGAWTHFP